MEVPMNTDKHGVRAIRGRGRTAAKLYLCSSVLIGLFPWFSAIAEVMVRNAWVRGTVPAQKVTGAFMTITSTEDAKLVGASSAIATSSEIHESAMHGGVMHMHGVEEVKLPAGKAVELKPGSYHLMLMGLSKPVTEGQKVPITLTVQDAKGKKSTVEVQAEVRGLGK